MKICEAFARQGIAVELVVPWRWFSQGQSPFEAYGVERNFTIRYIPTLDLVWLPVFKQATFVLQIATFSLAAALYCLLHFWRVRNDIVFFSHDYMPLWACSLMLPHVYYDIHHYPGNNFMYRRLMRASLGFASQTRWKVAELHKDFTIPPERIVAWPNGTDVDIFSQLPARQRARGELQLTPRDPLIVYPGGTGARGGAPTTAGARGYSRRLAAGCCSAQKRAPRGGRYARSVCAISIARTPLPVVCRRRCAGAAQQRTLQGVAFLHVAHKALRIHGKRQAHCRIRPAFNSRNCQRNDGFFCRARQSIVARLGYRRCAAEPTGGFAARSASTSGFSTVQLG
jgi:hypothetical protein